MRFAVLDPMHGQSTGLLHHIAMDGSIDSTTPLGYSPEVRYHERTGEIMILDSDADAQPMKYYLRLLDGSSLSETVRREIPVRPMYAGFPGRSVGGPISGSGRFVYFLRSGPVIFHPDDELTFRLTPVRWDRLRDAIDVAGFHIDSCHVDYGLTGNLEDDLFLHLSCECSSTVAFGSFDAPSSDLLRMESLPCREHGPLETNGSWLDAATGCLYCVNRVGTIYEIHLAERTFRVLARLRLAEGSGVPVHQIYGAAGEIHIGIAPEIENMGLGMVTEIWSVSAATGEFLGRRLLPQSIMSFVVTPDGTQLGGVNPYSHTVFCLDRQSGEEIWTHRGFGKTPGEILITGTHSA